jgi:tRNA G18 (ribose-2'-O)-methylase SpoU
LVEGLTVFKFVQCTGLDCGLRFPLDPEIHRGAFCPRCGARLEPVSGTQATVECPPPGERPARLISALLDNIRSVYNVGAIFRTADGVGLQHLFLCGLTPTPVENPSLSKTALGAELTLPWSQHLNAVALTEQLREDGYSLVGLECTSKATPIYRFKGEPPDAKPMVLIVGNERAGVDPGILDLCDVVLALPMMGEKESLNVAVAFGVAAYWLSYI